MTIVDKEFSNKLDVLDVIVNQIAESTNKRRTGIYYVVNKHTKGTTYRAIDIALRTDVGQVWEDKVVINIGLNNIGVQSYYINVKLGLDKIEKEDKTVFMNLVKAIERGMNLKQEFIFSPFEGKIENSIYMIHI